MNHHKILFLMEILMFACMVCASCGKNDPIYLETTEEAKMSETDADVSGSSTENHEATVSVIFVCGAVNEPGVFSLPEGSRVCDAIEAAGGLAEGACENFWNQAELLVDGQKIYVPTEEEMEDKALNIQEEETEKDSLVNLNTATKEELMTIPGVGSTRAEDIIAYRTAVGQFTTVEDVKNVSGIKDKVFEKMKNYIKVE